MSELQATIEVSVELNKFYNVDLFQRGFYQIRVWLKTPPKWPMRVETTLNKPSRPQQFRSTQATAAASIANNVAITRNFQILYRNEDLSINDAILYRIHTLVDSSRLEESLETLDLQLQVELWFSEEEEGGDGGERMELCSQRILKIHLAPAKGVHAHLPVLFDYFHLAALHLTVHAMLIALHQPYLNMPRPQKGSWVGTTDQSTLEAVYFGQRPLSGLPGGMQNSRMQQAHVMHKRICTLLLSAHESLQQTLMFYISKIPGASATQEPKDCHSRLENIILQLQSKEEKESMEEEEELIQQAITDITQLCAENVILWASFLEVATLRPQVHTALAREYHALRVRRFAEAFFTLENPKSACLSCYDPGVHGHGALASLVRSSAYFQQIQPLGVECTELDGDSTSLPIIFEDIYHDCWHPPTKPHASASTGVAKPKPDASPSLPTSKDRGETTGSESVSWQNGEAVVLRQKPPRVKKNNFIKNIKPEAFKRPSSSYSCSEVEKQELEKAVMLGGGTKDRGVTLIGYSKVPVPDTNPSKAVLLGTFSPHSPPFTEGQHLLATHSSVLSRTCWNRGSAASLPEISDLSRLSTLPPTTPTTTTATNIPIQGLQGAEVVVGSGEGLTGSLGQKRALFKAHRSNTAPVSDQGSSPYYVDGSPLSRHREAFAPAKDNSWGQSEGGSQGEASFLGTHSAASQAAPEGSPTVSSRGSNPDDVLSVTGIHCSVTHTWVEGGDGDGACSVDSGVPTITADSLSSPPSFSSVVIVPSRESGIQQDWSFQESPHTNMLSPLQDGGEAGRRVGAMVLVTPPAERKVTVMELLREEYERTNVREREKSASGPPSPPGPHLHPSPAPTLHCHRASSDTDILRNLEAQRATLPSLTQTPSSTLPQREKSRLSASSSYPELWRWVEENRQNQQHIPKLVSAVPHNTLNFVNLRETLKLSLNYPGHLYSESSSLASTLPYLLTPEEFDDSEGLHLIVCVHGLDGNSADLRLVRTYLEMALPGYRLEFLMSERNQQDTFADFEKMTERLVEEILYHMDLYSSQVSRISFVGHSLGTIIIRSALTSPRLLSLLPKMYTFLSLSGPHLGALYNNSGLVNMGMWFMQKWKKSGSLLQLSLKDTSDPRQSFLYRLSQKPVLQYFKHVLLVGSSQDRYVPYHSSRIEMCKAAQRDNSVFGKVYNEMVDNILTPIIQTPQCRLVRYDVFHALPSTANTIIGRAAHIAVLDSEIFIEKFLLVTGLQYFK